MRKLINLLASITLITGAATTVASCGTSSGPNVQEQNRKKVDSVVTKINDFLKTPRTFQIPESYTNLNDPNTTIAINLALQGQGLQLEGDPGKLPSALSNASGQPPTGEWADLSYSGTWSSYKINKIQIDVKVGSGSTVATSFIPDLEVQAATDAEVTHHLKDEITKGLQQISTTNPLILPHDIGTDPTTSDATKAINVALDATLKKAGVTLDGHPGGAKTEPTGDWSDITYTGTIPTVGAQLPVVPITIHVKYGDEQLTILLPVLEAQTNQEMATALSAKLNTLIQSLTNPTLDVPSNVNRDTTNEATREILNTELKSKDKDGILKGDPGDGDHQPTGDFSKIYYTGGPLNPPGGTAKDIGIKVRSNDTPVATYGPPAEEQVATGLQVTVAKTDQQNIDALFGEITEEDITLPYGTNYDTSDPTDINTIIGILENDNSAFKTALATPLFTVNKPTFNFGDVVFNMENDPTKDLTMKLTWKGKTYTYDNPIKASVNNTWTEHNSGLSSSATLRNAPLQIGNTLYLSSSVGLYKSTDNGSTWKQDSSQINILRPPVTLGNISYYSSDTQDTGRGFYIVKLQYLQNDVGQWRAVNMPGADRNGRSTFQAQPVRFNAGTADSPDWKYFIMSDNTGDFTSNDGLNWTKMSGAKVGLVERAPSRIGDTLYVGTYGNGLSQSTDKATGWQTWTKVADKGIPNTATIRNAPFYFGPAGSTTVKPFVYVASDASGGSITPTAATGVYYQDPTSGTWTKGTPATDKLPDDAQFLNTKPVKIGDTIYWQSSNKGLFYSKDEGQTWQQNNRMKTLSGQSDVKKIGSTYYIGTTGQGIWTSSDGLTWTQNPTDGLKTASILGALSASTQGSLLASAAKNIWKIPTS